MVHPVEEIVEPFRKDAIVRAKEVALKKIEVLKHDLNLYRFDRKAFAPYPNSMKMDMYHYQIALSKYKFVYYLTTGIKCSINRTEPDYCVINEDNVNQFINDAMMNADQEYTAFITKLISKIGDCDSATISGSHVWDFSVITVHKGNNIEYWKTTMIVNVSKFGKLFNQFPSRKIKHP